MHVTQQTPHSYKVIVSDIIRCLLEGFNMTMTSSIQFQRGVKTSRRLRPHCLHLHLPNHHLLARPQVWALSLLLLGCRPARLHVPVSGHLRALVLYVTGSGWSAFTKREHYPWGLRFCRSPNNPSHLSPIPPRLSPRLLVSRSVNCGPARP